MRTIEWVWDFYFARFFYGDHKIHRYHRYMSERWGEKYTNTIHHKERN